MRVTVVLMPDEPQPWSFKPVGFEAFLEWGNEDTYAEWVDGQIIMTSPASNNHQMVRIFTGCRGHGPSGAFVM